MPGRSATNVTSGSSFATVRHRLFNAALLALYGAQLAVAPSAEPELVNTTRPPRARSAGILQRGYEREEVDVEVRAPLVDRRRVLHDGAERVERAGVED
jgi:hypothetical protein